MSTFVREPCSDAFVRAAAQPLEISRQAKFAVLVASIVGSTMVFVDGSAVNVILPLLQSQLRTTNAAVQWVMEAYLLFLSALILVGGALGDRFGRRRVFMLGAAIFALASAACSVSQEVWQLVTARVVQGVGAALLTPGSLALIGACFPQAERGRAIGIWSAYTSIASAAGPVLGGWLGQHVSWRAIFLINLPLAALVLLVAACCVPESRDAASERSSPDWLGAFLIALALGCVVYGLIQSQASPTGPSVTLVVSAIGVASFVAFLFVETRVKAPMMPLSLFRSRSFAGANLLTLLLYAGIGGALFFVPFDLIGVERYSPTAAGAALLPMVVLLFLLSGWSGKFASRYGARWPLAIGPLVAGLGFLLFAVPSGGRSYWLSFFPAAVVLGLGLALAVAPLTTTVLESVASEREGLASGVNNAVARTASLVAIALFGIFLTYGFNRSLGVRLDRLSPPATVRSAIEAKRDKLNDIVLPVETSASLRPPLRKEIDLSFEFGYQIVMVASALLALVAGLVGFATVSPVRT